MTMNTTQIKEYSQLAQAAYAFFDPATFMGGSEPTFTLNLQGESNFTEREATDFLTRYRLLHQFQANGQLNGFSASLFQDKSSGKLVFAIRGTEFTPSGVGPDLLLTDLRIGIDGYASPQVIAMYRYFKQLTTASGQLVSYTADELARLREVYFDWTPTLNVADRVVGWLALAQQITADAGIDAGQGAQALIPAGQSVDVAGHSLGGHLALLMDRLFPARVAQIITLNAPGFFPIGNDVLDSFSPGWNDGRILRIEAAGDGVSEIGSIYPGSRVLVGQENTPLGAISTNHSSVNGVDGLALAELIGRLDSVVAADPRGVKALIDAGANSPGASYEGVLDGLRRMLIAGEIASTPLNDGVGPASRNQYYLNIVLLAGDGTVQSLAGKLRVSNASSVLSSEARSEFSAVVALAALSPIVLRGSSAENQDLLNSTLGAVHTDLYSLWQADQALSPADQAAGKWNITDQWLNDRAAMLSLLVQRNTADSTNPSGASGSGGPTTYRDIATTTEFSTGATSANSRLIVFGRNGADDAIFGGSGNDRHTRRTVRKTDCGYRMRR